VRDLETHTGAGQLTSVGIRGRRARGLGAQAPYRPRSARDAVNASQVTLYAAGQRLTVSYLRQCGCLVFETGLPRRFACKQGYYTAKSQASDACAARTTHGELTGVRAPSNAQPSPHLRALTPVARPGITAWFHVERRRSLARATPFGRRAPAPVPDRWTVGRSRAKGELHASELDRAHVGLSAESLPRTFRRPARPRGERHEPLVQDL